MINSRGRRLIRQKAALPRRERNLVDWNKALNLSVSHPDYLDSEGVKKKIALCESEIATLKTRIGGGTG